MHEPDRVLRVAGTDVDDELIALGPEAREHLEQPLGAARIEAFAELVGKRAVLGPDLAVELLDGRLRVHRAKRSSN